MSLLRMISLLSWEIVVMLWQERTSYIFVSFMLVGIQLFVTVCTHE